MFAKYNLSIYASFGGFRGKADSNMKEKGSKGVKKVCQDRDHHPELTLFTRSTYEKCLSQSSERQFFHQANSLIRESEKKQTPAPERSKDPKLPSPILSTPRTDALLPGI
jgi:hypothetical protein